jgi:transposase
MAKPSKVYPPDFRQKILELIRSGESGNAVARRFNVSRQTITNWLKQDERDSGRRTDVLTTEERSELTRLRREVKRLTIEQEILSKAAAWFARETDAIPKKSSDSRERTRPVMPRPRCAASSKSPRAGTMRGAIDGRRRGR